MEAPGSLWFNLGGGDGGEANCEFLPFLIIRCDSYGYGDEKCAQTKVHDYAVFFGAASVAISVNVRQ